ncbi:MAG: hypothetical protein QOH43_2325 [Solirubrobacteraceae bacterium]|jgi:hypothetical protein|nr:hypothetical protein [Solirubrobacteraceae bacterium]
MRRPPLLLVDIDGVISLWGFPPDDRPPGVWALVDGIGHYLSTTAADHLRALAADFELVWCSGWEEKANQELPAAIGVGPLPFLSFDRVPTPGNTHWKLGAIDEHAGDRPVAWIDDAFTPACETWARQRSGPTLLVPTLPATGLTAAEAAVLRDWAQDLALAA